MTKYQFYSIICMLWLIVSCVVISKVSAVIAFGCAVGYAVAVVYHSYKEEK